MSNIVAYHHDENILSFEQVVTLVQKQMSFIGYRQSRDDVAVEIRNSMKAESRSVFFIAYEEDVIAIGFAYGNICCGLETKGDYFWLNELYVSKDCRNQGLGSELLEYAQTWSKQQGCVYIALVTHPNNPEAQAFYQSQGMELEELVWVDKYL